MLQKNKNKSGVTRSDKISNLFKIVELLKGNNKNILCITVINNIPFN